MTSLSDILTAAKNIVTALNGLGQTYLGREGTTRSDSLSNSTTLVVAGQGRLVLASITTASGAAVGTVYDSVSASSLVNPIAVINFATGVQSFNIPFTNGLVVVMPSTITGIVTYSGGG